jgi:hypothetical protein
VEEAPGREGPVPVATAAADRATGRPASGIPGGGPIIRNSGPLWAGFAGIVRLNALQDRVVIDLLEYSDSQLSFKVRGNGDRKFGLRPLAIDPGILANQANFFTSLRGSIAEVGVKLPILVYGINDKLWVRYGASRVHSCRGLGLAAIPAVLCQFNGQSIPGGFHAIHRLETPLDVLSTGFLAPAIVGDFKCDHERIDAHRMEP